VTMWTVLIREFYQSPWFHAKIITDSCSITSRWCWVSPNIRDYQRRFMSYDAPPLLQL
jgi:hypothetical protein